MAKITAATTTALIADCKAEGKSVSVKVDDAPGLWLRVTSSGIASWSLVYRAKGSSSVRRYHLGRVADVSIKEAKSEVAEWRNKIAKGIDPQEAARQTRAEEAQEKQRAADEIARKAAEKAALKARLSVADAVEQFVAYKRTEKKRSAYNIERTLVRELVSRHGKLALVELTRDHVEAMQDQIAARGAARHADNATSMTRSLLSWALGKRLIQTNVAARFKRKQSEKDGRRERKLDAAEVKVLWDTLHRDDVGITVTLRRVILLALLLGSRLNEITGMRRSELSPDLMKWTIPAKRMKGGEEHSLPLPPHARSIIAKAMEETDGALIFPGREGKLLATTSVSHAMAKLQQHLGFTDRDGEPNPAKCHDLRRTLATGLQRDGVDLQVIKRVLAHIDGEGGVTTAHYAQAELDEEAGKALVRWQKLVARMVRGEDPFATRVEDTIEMERRLLGADLLIGAEVVLPANVVSLKAAG